MRYLLPLFLFLFSVHSEELRPTAAGFSHVEAAQYRAYDKTPPPPQHCTALEAGVAYASAVLVTFENRDGTWERLILKNQHCYLYSYDYVRADGARAVGHVEFNIAVGDDGSFKLPELRAREFITHKEYEVRKSLLRQQERYERTESFTVPLNEESRAFVAKLAELSKTWSVEYKQQQEKAAQEKVAAAARAKAENEAENARRIEMLDKPDNAMKERFAEIERQRQETKLQDALLKPEPEVQSKPEPEPTPVAAIVDPKVAEREARKKAAAAERQKLLEQAAQK